MEDERRVGFHRGEGNQDRASERAIVNEEYKRRQFLTRPAVVERLEGRPVSEVGDLSARRGASLRRQLSQ